MIEQILEELEASGFHHCLAVATDAEIRKGAACGQLAVIVEVKKGAPDSASSEIK